MRSRDLAFIALFAAIMVVLGLFPPITVAFIPVPITAQTLGVMLAGSIIGARRGALAMLVFLLLVVIGLPVLSGGRGGLGVFLTASGGFVLAFPVAAFVIGLLTEQFWRRYNLLFALVANIVGGILVVYAIGIPWQAVVAGLPLAQTALGSAIFLPGDLIKVVIASVVAVSVKRAYPVIEVAHQRR